MFALQTIISVILVSAIIAFVGDRVGHFIGRKRLTLFNLRPRTTAILITIITGILIALFTGIVLFVISSDVRTALFGMENLKKAIKASNKELEELKNDKKQLLTEIERLKNSLKKYQKEINSLQKTKQMLSNEIKTARKGQLLYNIGDVVTSTVIELKGNKEDTKNKILTILSNANNIIKQSIGGNREHYLSVSENELDEVITFLSDKKGSAIVRLIAASNVIVGEEIPIHFEVFENNLVFKKGENILSDYINPSLTNAEIEEKIKELLAKVNEIAIEKGMVPNPDGSVGTIAYSKIFEATKQIKNSKTNAKINVIVTKDTYSVGPLEIELLVK